MRFGPYQVTRELARGGMGAVFAVVHAETGARYALKTLLPEGLADEEERIRFTREARVLAQLEHPNLVRVFSAEFDGPRPYLVQELLSGGSLEDRLLRQGPLPREEALEVTFQLASALELAHAHGVLHRDLKPANVLVAEDGTVRLADFGLAKRLHDESIRLTQTGQLLGTPAYMAPEQASGAPCDARTDVYGLAAVLYALLSGAPPFSASSILGVLGKVMEASPPPLLGQSPTLRAVIARALSKEAADRPASVRAFADELREAAGATQSGRPWRAFAVFVGLAAVIVVGSFAGWAPATRLDEAPTRSPDSAGPSQTPSRVDRIPAASAGLEIPFDDTELTGDEVWTLADKVAFQARAEAQAAKEPESAAAWTNVARTCLGRGDVERARSAIMRAIELDARFGPAYRVRGMIYMRAKAPGTPQSKMGEVALAAGQRDFARALELDPDDWQAYRELAVVRTNLTNWSGAEAAFARWIELHPDAFAYSTRAYFEARRGRADAAQADFERALEHDPAHLNALQNLANIAKSKGDLRRESELVGRVLEVTPRSAPFLERQLILLAKLKESQRVIETARALAAVDPTRIEAPLREAFAHQHLSEVEASRSPVRRLLALEPEHPQGLQLLMRVQAEAQEWSQVIETCEKIRALRPPLEGNALRTVEEVLAHARLQAASASSGSD